MTSKVAASSPTTVSLGVDTSFDAAYKTSGGTPAAAEHKRRPRLHVTRVQNATHKSPRCEYNAVSDVQGDGWGGRTQMNSNYGPALRRFWWIVALGGVFALLVGVLMVYSVEAGLPPKLTEREQPVYTAEARLFVTSGDAPYLRTSVPRSASVPIGTDDNQTAAVQTNEAPDVSTLVDAANVYPLLIESDAVATLRSEMFKNLPVGTVEAQAIFSTATPSRYRPSEIPVIVLFGSSGSATAAIRLADATSKAFRTWIVREQTRAGIDPKQRILIAELETPTTATVVGGTELALPAMAVLALLTAFCATAILLDRNFPRPEQAEEAAARDLDARERHAGIAETG